MSRSTRRRSDSCGCASPRRRQIRGSKDRKANLEISTLQRRLTNCGRFPTPKTARCDLCSDLDVLVLRLSALRNLRLCRSTLTVRQSSGMARVVLPHGNPIPLTLTLSHGEREQSASGSVVRQARRADPAPGCAEGQRRILPLPEGPEGEGRGEGKGDARCANRVSSSSSVC